ncbi:hypothetical protein ACFP2T_13620 [Plantactinospora solaniradicis]|uniref:XRE family transcriptional regulator n=1 Tax=Plantactinospora solaniradicis TaxID=1723736 RepID=A0ABW1K7K6_9ACTN
MNAADDGVRPEDWSGPGLPPVPFRQAVGGAIRRLRQESGRTQDDVARSAREAGVAWDRSKVAALERGEKAITAEELILLPYVLKTAGVQFHDIVELFGPPDQMVGLTRRAFPVRPSEIAWMLRGMPRPPTRDPSEVGLLFGLIPVAPGTRVILPDPDEEDAAIKRIAELGFADLSYHAFQRAAAFSGEAEEKAARKFGEPKAVIAGIAAALWGKSLTQERDERVLKAIGDDLDSLTPRQIQATRGHHTRKLLTEMEIRLADAAHSKAQRRVTDVTALYEAVYGAREKARENGSPPEELARLKAELDMVRAGLVDAMDALQDADQMVHSARLDRDQVVDTAIDRLNELIDSGQLDLKRIERRRRKKA